MKDTGIIRKSTFPSLHLLILFLIVSQNLKAPEDQPSRAFSCHGEMPFFRFINTFSRTPKPCALRPMPYTVLFPILQLEHILPRVSLYDLNDEFLPRLHNNTIPPANLRNKEKVTQNNSILSP